MPVTVAPESHERSVRVAALAALAALGACASAPEAYSPGELSAAQRARCRAVAQAYFDRAEGYVALRDGLREDVLAAQWFVRYLIHSIVTMREGQSVLLSEEKVRLDTIRRMRSAPAQFDLPGQRDDLRAIGEIVAMGEPAIEVVVEDLLKNRQEFLRTIAAEVLAAFGDRAVPEVLEVATSGDARERGYAARALGAIGARGPALEALRQLTTSAQWRVRSAAVQALGDGGDDARDLLVRMLADEDPFVRRKAAETLANYPGAGAAAALVAVLEASKAREEWPSELAAQQALQQIAGADGPRSVAAWRRFVAELRGEGR